MRVIKLIKQKQLRPNKSMIYCDFIMYILGAGPEPALDQVCSKARGRRRLAEPPKIPGPRSGAGTDL